ncbi:MAG: hypothetical protein EOM19_02185 [Candidatus Moranbacteria bacterium]|nr:hypothetical protein [Candidatus Moranbacteria bacterium]
MEKGKIRELFGQKGNVGVYIVEKTYSEDDGRLYRCNQKAKIKEEGKKKFEKILNFEYRMDQYAKICFIDIDENMKKETEEEKKEIKDLLKEFLSSMEEKDERYFEEEKRKAVIFEGLSVIYIKRTTTQYFERQELTLLEIRAEKGNETVYIKAKKHMVGTYKNDNVRKVSDILREGYEFDLIEGEAGWGINVDPRFKKYYSPSTYFMPDDCEVTIQTKLS